MAALHRWLRGLLFQLLALITQVRLPADSGWARGGALPQLGLVACGLQSHCCLECTQAHEMLGLASRLWP